VLKNFCRNENIKFDKYDQYVCYIAYIFNLAVQKILMVLKTDKATDKDKLLQDEQNTLEICEIIPKVN
jgi:hypothetical protein